ncbi:MAG: hypothetical protein P1U85_17240 [Verrucomicrobiales bacterium]|nr:hypothetical protein [Verrucomicrobiales bacterium]
MAIRLGEHVRRGTIDNSEKGVVRGHLEIVGRNTPLELELQGNAYLDLAGCILTFSNEDAVEVEPELAEILEDLQTGFAGDITASKKSQVIDLPVEDFRRMSDKEREESAVWKTVLFIEWFSHFNGRIVIEGLDYDWEIDLPRWELNDEEIGQQVDQAKAAKELHLNFALEMFQETNEEIRAAEDEIDPDATDEFTWEKRLQESDRRAEAFHALLEEASNPEEMERLADLAFEGEVIPDFPDQDEEGKGVGEMEESSPIESRDAYVPSPDVLDSCREIRKRCKALISDHYDELLGTVAHSDFLALVVKAQTAADLVERGEGSFERGFLIAHVKREIARSQHLLGLLQNEPDTVKALLIDEIWKVRDGLVQLSGQLRKDDDIVF